MSTTSPDLLSAYEQGYQAAATGRPRKVPGSVRKILPSLSPEWFRGYDSAKADCQTEQTEM